MTMISRQLDDAVTERMKSERSHRDALATIATARAERMGFLNEDDIRALSADNETRLTKCLVRCGGCRFICGAQDVAHLIGIIEREGSDYVRDVSLLPEPIR
jgi:hypothetical protein